MQALSFIRLKERIIISFPDGQVIEKNGLTESQIAAIKKCKTKEAVLAILCPAQYEEESEYNIKKELYDRLKTSSVLTLKGDAIYMPNVSELSVPLELAVAIVRAEAANNADALTAYKNFWTLMSLNTDSRCRQNLFWYLQKWGMRIAKCGFFVGYRNVDYTTTPDIYTDHHSKTFKIKVGEVVTMPREQCDTVQEHQCSTGLHLSARGWLTEGYFGDVGLACLCNPADVCAVPYNSSYGKLRTCAYLPIALVNYDDTGNVIPLDVEDGFDCKYVAKVIYEGLSATEESPAYKIQIPDIPELSKEGIKKSLYNIAFDCITKKNKIQ